MSFQTLKVVAAPGNLLSTVQRMIDRDADEQLFQATVASLTSSTITIQRTGHDPETARYAVIDSFPYPAVDDEVIVARVGSGFIIVGKVLRTGLVERYLTIETELRILPGGKITWGSDGLNSIDDDLITIEVSDDEAIPTDVMLFKRGALTHRTVMTAAVETGPSLAFWDMVAETTGGAEGARLSVQAGSTAISNRAAVVGNDLAGTKVSALVAFGNGEARADGFFTTFKGDTPTARVISGGAITIEQAWITIDTEGAAPTDILTDINAAAGLSLQNGQHLFLKLENGARTITIEEGGNVALDGGTIDMDTVDKVPHLLYDGTNWSRVGEAGGGMELLVKSVDETIDTDTTLSDDAKLLFPVAANENWQFEGVVWVTSGATPQFKFTFDGPAGSVGMFEFALDEVFDTAQELGTADNAGSGTRKSLSFRGSIANGGTAGNLAFQWAQNVSDAGNTTVEAGSYIRFQKE